MTSPLRHSTLPSTPRLTAGSPAVLSMSTPTLLSGHVEATTCVLCHQDLGMALRKCSRCSNTFHHMCAIEIAETQGWSEAPEGQE
ncbi:hypothetical protein H257_19457, partial [Aphanomyces astaci]